MKSGKKLLCLLLASLFTLCLNTIAFCDYDRPGMNISGIWNVRTTVDPIDEKSGWSATLYNNRNGLPTSEANAITQTREGFIWIGSYAGLIRYDGNRFERFDKVTGLSNIRCFYVDKQGRLWIGTNDAGVFLMENGEFRNWNKKDGMRSVSVRAISEDAYGLIYIADTAGIAVIDKEMNLQVLEDERISGQLVPEIHRGNDGAIYGLTSAGDLFSLKGGELVSFLGKEDSQAGSRVGPMLPDPLHPGFVYFNIGDFIYHGSLEAGLDFTDPIDISAVSSLERMEWINGQLWLCARSGIGKVVDGTVRLLESVPLNNSIGNVLTDSEGNLWFTSTRQGVMKIVPNQFTDLFELNGLPPEVVNTTCSYGRSLFIGTDNGLIVVEDGQVQDKLPLTKAVTASGKEVEAEDLIDFLKGTRIRSIIRDSKNRLWISTAAVKGLIRYDKDEILEFTMEDGLLADAVRVVSECSDGSMIVATNNGVNVIDGEKVTASYGSEEGIVNKQILTVAEGFHGDLLIGSDGDGIYVIDSDGTRKIGTEEGLSSEVILRIKRSTTQDVFWIITGNSIAYMTPDYQIISVEQFPYANNYDLYENSVGDAWVLSSHGIYVTPVAQMLENKTISSVNLGIENGLPFTSTANSYSELTEDEDLYIAGNAGVAKINIAKPFQNMGRINSELPFVDADGKRLYPGKNGGFTLPAGVRRLTVYPYVLNYTLSNPNVTYCLEGYDEERITVSRNELGPVNYVNLPNGTYEFVMRVDDPVGHTDKTVLYKITKGGEMTVGQIGSIMMDLFSLLFMAGIMIYTSLYRQRGRLEDRLFFIMLLANMVLALVDGTSFLLEGVMIPFAKEIMTAENIIFYFMFELYLYLYVLYLDAIIERDTVRIHKKKLLMGLPCFIVLFLLVLNLKTGWIFYFAEDNVYHSGPYNNIVFLPAVIYVLLAWIRLYKINYRLVLLSALLITTRVCWGIWFRDISSTAFTFTLFLASTHIYVMNKPLTEETS